MGEEAFFDALGGLEVGKQTHGALYLHRSTISRIPEPLSAAVAAAAQLAEVAVDEIDVIKFSLREHRLSLLTYPGFFETAFPLLTRSWAVDLDARSVVSRDFVESENPPVLHRKEAMLFSDHPAYSELTELTVEAEGAGLFDDPAVIGHQLQWDETLRSKGLKVDGAQLIPLEEVEHFEETSTSVKRHRTAIHRRRLSTPIQALARHGFLDRGWTIFDYGCGRGDDVYIMRQKGVAACGWDPFFAPDEPKVKADIVNLGFVLNVIEDPDERRETLKKAYGLAGRLMSVSVLIGGRTAYERRRLFRDGVLTARGTFQKYFTQEELRTYLEETLGREPIAMAPGIFFVFRTNEDEQEYLVAKQHLRSMPLGSGWHISPSMRQIPKRSRPRRSSSGTRRSRAIWAAPEHEELLEAYWQRAVVLGRMPEDDEFDRIDELCDIGKTKAAFRYLVKNKGTDEIEAASRERGGDLLVYLALNMFERRKSFRSLPRGVRRDVKAFFGTHRESQQLAKELLFSIGKPSTILKGCQQAAERGIGHLDGEHSLQLHSSLTSHLPPVLRVYLGCAARLFGEVESVDVLKIHVQSGKVTLLYYEKFEESPLPVLIERIKINLRHQSIQFYSYDEQNVQVLYLKSRYIREGFPHYEEQVAFDKELEERSLFSFEDFGPSKEDFDDVLENEGLTVRGFELTSS